MDLLDFIFPDWQDSEFDSEFTSADSFLDESDIYEGFADEVSQSVTLDAGNSMESCVTDIQDSVVYPLSYMDTIPFTGNTHIDSLYDPHIENARDRYDEHTEALTEPGLSTEKMEYHYNESVHAKNDEDFWKDCKKDAEIESKKNNIFNEYISDINSIIDRSWKEKEK